MLYAATLYEPGSDEHASHLACVESALGREYIEYLEEYWRDTQGPRVDSALIGFLGKDLKSVFHMIREWKEDAEKVAKAYEQLELAWATG